MTSRTRGLAVAACLAAAAVAPQAAQAATAKPDVTVMSRNLYLGADIIKLASSPDVQAEQQKAAELQQTVVKTNFPLRAKAIVKEIAKTKPDVIGLQEVARYYRGPDGVHDGKTNASTVIYDYLAIIKKELKAKKLGYKVVSRQDELDIETASAEGYDLRLVLGNAVLVKTGKDATVKFKKDLHGTFTDQLDVPLPDQTVRLKRGYAGMQGEVAGKKFIFIDPHAEAYSGAIATKQFEQLLKTGAKNKKIPTIMAGDFNSDPAAPGADSGGYNAVIKAGFKNTGKRKFTCCQNEFLTNPTSLLSEWIDHIVVRPAAKVLSSTIVGNKPSDKIGGLWPSDHAGVVAKLRLK